MGKVIILGNFDGVHIGHQKLIQMAIDYAKKNNMKTMVYTFNTLPNNKKHIMTVDEKVKKIKSLGVDDIYIDDFYRVKNYSPLEFINEILIGLLDAKKVFCGFNYTFGCKKQGCANKLSKYIDTTILQEYKDNDITVSSSYIRKLILSGDMDSVKKYLGDYYIIEGYVIHGQKLGRTIGYPTANIRPNDNKIMPPLGAYGVEVKIQDDDNIYLGIMNIGKNPTVSDDDNISIETNILDFNGDIYSKKIEIKIMKLLRYEQKFESIDKLKQQLTNDEKNWRNINAKY